MKIGFMIGTLKLGGAERQLCRLAIELKERGQEVKVFVLGEGGPLEAQLVSHDVEFEILGSSGISIRNQKGQVSLRQFANSLKELHGCWRRIKEYQPDVFHAYLYFAYVYGMIWAWLSRVPVRIASRRGFSSLDPNRLRDRFLLTLANLATTQVITNTAAITDDAALVEPFFPKTVEVIANGVDIPQMTADVARQPPQAVVVANLIQYKGHSDLIEALALLTNPPRILLVGEGAERQVLEERVRSLGLESSVVFLGRRLDVVSILLDCQFAIHPSHTEGSPNGILEAMSCGLPVIATSVGGVPELIESGMSGRVVPAKDVVRLSEAIREMTESPELRVVLGTAARHRAETFSWDSCARKHLALYERLLQSKESQGFLGVRKRSRRSDLLESLDEQVGP